MRRVLITLAGTAAATTAVLALAAPAQAAPASVETGQDGGTTWVDVTVLDSSVGASNGGNGSCAEVNDAGLCVSHV